MEMIRNNRIKSRIICNTGAQKLYHGGRPSHSFFCVSITNILIFLCWLFFPTPVVIYAYQCRGRRGRDRMVVRFTTTYAIGSYHHWCCEFESRTGRGIQHYVIKFVSDLRQVVGFLLVLHQLNWLPRYSSNIVESGVKHHQANKQNCSWRGVLDTT